jgi:hypothetical protein
VTFLEENVRQKAEENATNLMLLYSWRRLKVVDDVAIALENLQTAMEKKEYVVKNVVKAN